MRERGGVRERRRARMAARRSPPPAGADKTVKMHPTDIPWYDYIGRKDPVTGEITCPWRKGRGKVQSGGSSGVQMAAAQLSSF